MREAPIRVPDILRLMLLEGGSALPNTHKLARVYLCLTPTSVDAERGASLLKLIKTDRRNRLSAASLSQQMFVKQNGPTVHEFLSSGKADAVARYFLASAPRNCLSGRHLPVSESIKAEHRLMDQMIWDIEKVSYPVKFLSRSEHSKRTAE